MECQLISQSVYKCTWSIPKFGSIYEKCNANQKLTSPVSEDLPFGDGLVRCRLLLFPKGTSDDSEEGCSVVAVQFASSGVDATKLSFSCLMRCISSDSEILDDISQTGSALCGVDMSFGHPAMCTFSLLDETASLMISITFRPFSEERELIDNVRSGIFSFQTAVTSFMAQKAASGGGGGGGSGEVQSAEHEVVHSPPTGLSEIDSRLINLLTRPPQGSDMWTSPRWSVLLHVCVAFDLTRDMALVDTEVQEAVKDPAPEALMVLFSSCPPLRSRLAEERFDEAKSATFWSNLLYWLQRFSKVSSAQTLRAELFNLNQPSELLDVLLFAVEPSAVTYFDLHEVRTISERLRETTVAILESSQAESFIEELESGILKATEVARNGMHRQQQLRQRVSALVGYHTWHADAERCLTSGLETGLINPLEKSIEAATRLRDILLK